MIKSLFLELKAQNYADIIINWPNASEHLTMKDYNLFTIYI
jgi:hypothetical protein